MFKQNRIFCQNRILRAFSIFLLGFLMLAKTASAVELNPIADFDGDGKSDISVFRMSDGTWHILKSSGGNLSVKWGLPNDIPVPGDYDGDGKTDLAVQRWGSWSQGSFNDFWYILRSSDNAFLAKQWGFSTGFSGWSAVQRDYDGDGKTDIASFEGNDIFGSPGSFIILKSSNNSETRFQWGTNADYRVPADYDGDGKTDLAVYRTGNFPGGVNEGTWFILQSSNNVLRIERFGLRTDRPVPADYDGDKKTDIAVYRPSDGFWYRINSSSDSFSSVQFGISADIPVPADYDGDGKTDIGVFRTSNGVWYLQRSSQGFLAQPFGLTNDIPLPSLLAR